MVTLIDTRAPTDARLRHPEKRERPQTPLLKKPDWLRVQVSPMIIMVAWLWLQHSPMFGQAASSQTVVRPCSLTMARVAW